MTLNILFLDSDQNWALWQPHLTAALDAKGIAYNLTRSPDTPAQIDYVIYSPSNQIKDFSPFTRLKAVLSMWAGVEKIVGNASITVPLSRMVDPGLTEGMVEYVTGHTLRYHLDTDQYVTNRPTWDAQAPPKLARSRSVGILGLGVLGNACAEALRDLNFNVVGWSRSKHDIDGIDCYGGTKTLDTVLALSEILILLLPETPETTDLIDKNRLAQLPKGSCIINPGRGTAIVDNDLVDAIRRGNVKAATLDVFRTEPLPESHPFWEMPEVTITPHIAAATHPETAALVIAENIQRSETSAPLLNVVDRKRGY